MAAIATTVQLVLNLTAPAAVTAPAFLGANIDTAALFQGTSPHRLCVPSRALQSAATHMPNLFSLHDRLMHQFKME